MADAAATGRRLGGVTTAELERRWTLVRDYMRERKLDAVIALSTDSNNSSSYTRWLTDQPPSYRHVVVFHADGPMTTVEHGPHGQHRTVTGDDPGHRGVGEVINVAEFPNVNYTQDYEAKEVAALLLKRGVKRIGLVLPAAMPHIFVKTIEDALAGKAEIVDVTEAFDRWKAIKSAEEKAMIRQAIAMHDIVFQKLIEKIKPGMRDLEVASIIHYEGRLLGSTHGTILAGSAAPGQPAGHLPPHLQGRTFQKGDCMNVLLENVGPGGWFGELGRPIVLGRASNEILDAFEKAKESQEHTRKLMVAGAAPAEIFAKHNEHAKKIGIPPATRIYAHAQGYEIVERPLIRFDEPMALEPDMFFAVHPNQTTASVYAFVCDNCFIAKDGAPGWEHKTEQKVFEI